MTAHSQLIIPPICAVLPNLFLASAPFLTNKFLSPPYQWRAEIWWCPWRLLDCIPP